MKKWYLEPSPVRFNAPLAPNLSCLKLKFNLLWLYVIINTQNVVITINSRQIVIYLLKLEKNWISTIKIFCQIKLELYLKCFCHLTGKYSCDS